MKFKQEEANKELVARMTSKGEKLNLSQRSIDGYLENLMPLIATEEMELDEFVGKVLPFFQTSDANVRHDVSVHIKEHDDKQTPPTLPKDPPTVDDETSKTIATLSERIQELESANAKSKEEAFQKETKRTVFNNLKAKGVKNEKWIERMLSRTTFKEDSDLDKEVEDLVGLYNDMMGEYDPDTVPGQPSGGGSGKYVNDTIKAASAYAKQNSLN